MALPYGQVKDLYDQLHDAGVVTQSLPDWSAQMGDLTGTDTYSEGLHDNIVRRASHGLDKLLDASGLPDLGGSFGRSVGDVFGMGDVGEAAGRSLPRSVVDMAPLALTPFIGPAAPVLAGALMGAHTYADTGSVGAGVTSGIVGAALPGIANKATQFALGGLGARYLSEPITNALGKVVTPNAYLPESVGVGSRFLAESAGHVAGALTMGAGDIARQALDPNDHVTNPFTPEFALSLGLQTLPFSALHAGSKLLGHGTPYDSVALDRNIETTRLALKKQADQRAVEQAPPVTQNPTYDESAFTPEQKLSLDEAKSIQQQLIAARQKASQPTATDSDHDNLQALQQASVDATGGVGTLDGQFIDPPDDVTHVPLVGKDYVKGDNGRYAHFTVVEHPTNVDTGYEPGDRVRYSTVYEHAGPPVDNGDGTTTVQVPVGYHSPVEDKQAGMPTAKPVVDKGVGTSDLPAQENPLTPERQEADQKLAAAQDLLNQASISKDPEVFHQAKVTFNDARVAAGFSPVDDVTLAEWQQMTQTTAEQATAGKIANLMSLIDKKEATKKAQADAFQQLQARTLAIGSWGNLIPTSKIKSAASRTTDGRVFTGSMHALSEERARNSGYKGDLQQGYVKGDGTFISSEEAADKLNLSDSSQTEARQGLEAALAERLKDFKEGRYPEMFWKVVSKWNDTEQKGGLDRLDDMLAEKGRTRVKEKSVAVVAQAEEASKQLVPAAQHTRDQIAAIANHLVEQHYDELTEEQQGHAHEWIDALEKGLPVSKEAAKSLPLADWKEELDDMMARMTRRAPQVSAPPIPAGDRWVWGLGSFDEASDSLNGKPLKSIGAANGVMPESRFLNMAGRGKPLNATELAVGKVLVPEAFDGKGNVDVRKLYAGLKGREPVVETKTLGEPQKAIAGDRAQIGHDLDTRFPGWADRPRAERTDEEQTLRNQYYELNNQSWTHVDTAPGTQYSFLGPKSESDMPGYVEGLVRLPLRDEATAKAEVTKQQGYAPFGPSAKVDTARGVKYSGPHFGSEDKNVLAFYRGYEETLPDGTKAFHVIETQSDWGQAVRKEKDPDLNIIGDKYPDHPLLKDDVWKTLALKAAIQHAREVGATKIILSDGETAMMTEGHDKAANNPTVDKTFENIQLLGKKGVKFTVAGERLKLEDGIYPPSYWEGNLPSGLDNQPSQSAGMRLHYDSALPSAMKKLTGDGGEVVDLGTHKAAESTISGVGAETRRAGRVGDWAIQLDDLDNPGQRFNKLYPDEASARKSVAYYKDANPEVKQLTQEDLQPIGSPVFRNADGTPKSTITGRIYDLTTAFARQDEQDGASTLGDPTRSPQVTEYHPTSEQEQAIIDRHGLDKTGVEVMASLTSDPLLGGLAKDLGARFANTLRRIVPSVVDSSDPSSARMGRNNIMSLAFSRGLLGMNDTNRAFELMHELVHGLTEHALADEKNVLVVGQFDQLRQRLIAALPKDQRAIFDNLVKTNWYDRWATGGGKAAFSDLGPDARGAMKLYGLLNNSELLAQGFSSSDMRQFMESVKGTQGVSGWSGFKNFVKDILGLGEKVKGTAFDEFMNYSSRLMGAGEHVSQAHNFLEGIYRNQGLGDADAQRQTTRALGMLQGSGWDGTKDGLLDTLTQRQVMPTAAVIKATTAVYKGLAFGHPDEPIAKSVMGELGFMADVRRVDDMLESHLRGGIDIRDALRLLPDSITNYIYAKVNDFKQVVGGASAASAKVNDGLLNVSHPEEIRTPLAEISKTLEGLQAVQREAKEVRATVQALTAVSPDGYVAAVLRAPQQATTEGPMNSVADFVEPTSKKLWKGFVNFTQQMGQLAKTNPETAELINLGFRMKPAARWMANQMMRPFALDPNNPEMGFSRDTKTRTSQVFRDKKVLAAVNNWIFQNQKVGGDAVTRLAAAHPDVARGLQGLTDEQKNLAENAVIMHGAMKTIGGNFILNKMANIASWDATGILSENGKKASDNFQLTSGLFRNLAMTDWNNPQEAALAQQQIGTIQSNMTPEQFLDLTKFMQAEVGKWQTHKDFFTQNSDWATAKRYGKFLVEYMDNGKRVTAGVDSKKEADVLTRGKQVLDFKSNVKEGVDDDFIPSIGMNAGLRQRVADAQATADSILQSKLSPEAFEQYQKYNPATQLLTEAQGGGIPDNQVGYARTRQLSKGAENLPWLENQFKWVQNTASYWSRSEFRAQARGMLSDPEITANPDIRSRLATHVDNMLTPDPEAAQLMTKFVSTWALGFRPSTAIVTASHSIIRHTAELTRLTGKPIDSFNRMRKALSEIVNTVTGGEQNPEHGWLMKEADKFGERENGWFDDENSNQEKVVLNFLDDVKGDKPRTLGQQLSSAGGTYSRVGMWMFQQARRMNEEAALYASYDYYREQGLTQVQARDKAFEFNHAVNTVGGTAQRPAGLFQAGVPRTASMAAYSLKSYVVGTIGQLGRYIMEGSPWAHENLTPAEKWNARKAAMQMVAMQASAAGLLGLPAVGSGIALLNQLFPQLQLPQKTREGVSDLLGGDHWSTDVAMGGLPSMLGWDLKSRLSLGNVVPGVDESQGFQPSQLLGAPVSLATKWITGAKSLASGDPAGLVNLMPSGVKDVLRLAGADGPTSDARGRQLFQPTPGEVVGTALGFRSTRLSDVQTQERLSQQTSRVLNEQEGKWRQARAQDVMKGNFGSVRQALIQRTKDDSNYDAVSAGRDIANAAEAMSFPYDPTRTGNVSSAEQHKRLLATFSMPTAPANEVARTQFRIGVLQRLGLNPGDVGSQLRQAQLEDQIKTSLPTLTKAQVQQAARRMLSAPRMQPLLSETQ